MPVCVLDINQDVLFFLTCNRRDGQSSKVTVVMSEKLLRSWRREDFFRGEGRAGPCTGMRPKKTWIVRRSVQGFALSPSCRTFGDVMVELLLMEVALKVVHLIGWKPL